MTWTLAIAPMWGILGHQKVHKSSPLGSARESFHPQASSAEYMNEGRYGLLSSAGVAHLLIDILDVLARGLHKCSWFLPRYPYSYQYEYIYCS